MEFKGKLHETVVKFPDTDIWNDSSSLKELEYALERGAVGATTNPIIVGNVLREELSLWEDTIKNLVRDNPSDTEDDIAWKIIEVIGTERSKLLLPAFKKFEGKKGRLSMQTNPKYYRNALLMLEQAVHFSTLAENVQVKMPATAAGVRAMEEATFAGVSINATVSFTLPQAIQVAEAVERGLQRRKAAGLPTETMGPVCTLMIGRLDDYLKEYLGRNPMDIDMSALEWAGIAVFKKAYTIYKERGYTTRLLSAAYRNLNHWAELVGGDCCMTIPHEWQVKINECDMDVISRIETPVEENILRELNKIPTFRQAYAEDGISAENLEHYGATRRTMTSFLAGYDTLVKLIRGYLVIDPEIDF